MASAASATLKSLASLLISPLKSGMKTKDRTPRTVIRTPRKMMTDCIAKMVSGIAAMMAALITPTTRPVTP